MPKSLHFPKVKPTHFTLSKSGSWINWPFGELSVAALNKHELGKPKNIQGMFIHSLYGGLKADNTYWRWDCFNGFTDGEHAHGSTPE